MFQIFGNRLNIDVFDFFVPMFLEYTGRTLLYVHVGAEEEPVSQFSKRSRKPLHMSREGNISRLVGGQQPSEQVVDLQHERFFFCVCIQLHFVRKLNLCSCSKCVLYSYDYSSYCLNKTYRSICFDQVKGSLSNILMYFDSKICNIFNALVIVKYLIIKKTETC